MEDTTTNEEHTFNILRRQNIDEICKTLSDHVRNNNMSMADNFTYLLYQSNGDQYSALQQLKLQLELDAMIMESGWTKDELYNQIRKNAARLNIDNINKKQAINQSMIDSIIEIFPNVTVIHGGIKE